MLEFKTVTRDDVRPLAELEVSQAQQGLVSPNAITMAEAAFEPGALVRGMWSGDTPVGLIAMVNPKSTPPDDEDPIPRDCAHLWRLMIAGDHQGKGFGALAMEEALATARRWGFAKVALTVVDRPDSARKFYECFGFKWSGRILFGDELEMISDLDA